MTLLLNVQCFFLYTYLLISAINGIIYNLQGLQMYQDELVRWHLLNMGNPKDVHVINFHGQTVTESINNEHRLAVYPLIPGILIIT